MPLFRLIICSTCILAVIPEAAAAFSDLPEDHFAYEAVKHLEEKGILSGYEDGTFQPEKTVNRAEALKIITAPRMTDAQFDEALAADTLYSDIKADDWYKPYVEHARRAGIIDGPPKKTVFNGQDTVIKVEFLKMVQETFGAAPRYAFNEISLPLSQDVSDIKQWYYPYMRYGITSSMTKVDSAGRLSPAKALTRAEASVLLFRYMMYEQKKRTDWLLAEIDQEIDRILSFLEEEHLTGAEYASARALLAARGAHLARPDEMRVQGAVKITESFRSLVRGYRAASDDDVDETIRLAGEAWNLATRAKDTDARYAKTSDEVQSRAKRMADEARERTAGDTTSE